MIDLYTKYNFTIWAITIVFFLTAVLGRAYLGRWLASEKGRSQTAWFWLCLFFGIFAIIVLGFAPLNAVKKTIPQRAESRNPDMSVTWKCPKCSTENANDSYSCKSCGYRLK